MDIIKFIEDITKTKLTKHQENLAQRYFIVKDNNLYINDIESYLIRRNANFVFNNKFLKKLNMNIIFRYKDKNPMRIDDNLRNIIISNIIIGSEISSRSDKLLSNVLGYKTEYEILNKLRKIDKYKDIKFLDESDDYLDFIIDTNISKIKDKIKLKKQLMNFSSFDALYDNDNKFAEFKSLRDNFDELDNYTFSNLSKIISLSLQITLGNPSFDLFVLDEKKNLYHTNITFTMNKPNNILWNNLKKEYLIDNDPINNMPSYYTNSNMTKIFVDSLERNKLKLSGLSERDWILNKEIDSKDLSISIPTDRFTLIGNIDN